MSLGLRPQGRDQRLDEETVTVDEKHAGTTAVEAHNNGTSSQVKSSQVKSSQPNRR